MFGNDELHVNTSGNEIYHSEFLTADTSPIDAPRRQQSVIVSGNVFQLPATSCSSSKPTPLLSIYLNLHS